MVLLVLERPCQNREPSLPPLTFPSFASRTDSRSYQGKTAASLCVLRIKSESDANSYKHIIVSGVGSFLMKNIKIKA